jgi:hypothetical protein
MNRAPDNPRSAAAVASVTFSDLAGMASSHTRIIFSSRTLILIVDDEGEVVKGVWLLVADDDAGLGSMATTCPTQFAAT